MALDYISYTQAGVMIGCGVSQIQRFVRRGLLEVQMLPGGRPRVSAQAVMNLAKLATFAPADAAKMRLQTPKRAMVSA